MGIQNFIDWFIPENLKNDLVLKSKARIAVSVMFAFGIVLIPNLFRGLRIGRVDIAIMVVVVSALMMSGPFILKKTQSLLIAGNFILTAVVVFFTFVTVVRGGASSYYAMNFLMIILTAFLITNLSFGIFWGAISVILLVAMRVAENMGYPFEEVSSDSAHINVLVIVAIVTLIGAIYEWNSAGNLRQLDMEKRQSEESAKTLRTVLDETNQVMGAVAEADLSLRIKSGVSGDLAELKNSVNSALELLGENVKQVLSICSEINNGTGEMSNAAQELASGATQQAASLEEISSSMAEIGSKAETNDDNATRALQLSNQTVEELDRGNAQMDSMLNVMQTINETSSNVAKVVKVIDEIAFQTNLLALNAAVEAARAGKYGKGFAVVADEVRSLAVRSAEAAKDTTQLIDDSLKQVENGVDSAKSTADTLKGFVNTINKVNDIIGEISAASQEQAGGVTEINRGLTQVNQVVQRNSSISEESASASEELSSQTELLQNLMRRFKLTNLQTVRPTGTAFKENLRKVLPPATPGPVVKKETGTALQKQIVLDDDDFGKY